MFCLVTALIPMMMNLKTKYWIYEKLNKLVVIFYKQDKEAVNFVQKPKSL